jgi:hypothetical protein
MYVHKPSALAVPSEKYCIPSVGFTGSAAKGAYVMVFCFIFLPIKDILIPYVVMFILQCGILCAM